MIKRNILRLTLSTIILFGLVACGDVDSSESNSADPCENLIVNAGIDKIAVVNEGIVITGNAKNDKGSISSYEWREDSSTLSSTSSFTHYPTSIGKQVLSFIVTDDSGCEKSDSMILTVQSSLSPETTPHEDVSSSDKEWTNGTLKASILSLKKTGEWITIEVVYKNLSEEDISLYIEYYQTHLLDEDGNIWNFKGDTAVIFKGRTILPFKQIKTEIKFQAKDSKNGTKFDLIINASPSEFTHRILDIVPFEGE